MRDGQPGRRPLTSDKHPIFSDPTKFLMAINFVNWIGFASWSALINSFAVEAAGFTFRDNGVMQSVREIPGLLAFTAIFWLLLMREQLFAYFAMLALSLGVFLTGWFPSFWGILITTYIMSVGFHYMETAQQSLALQLLPKATAAREMGKVSGAGAMAQFIAYGGVAAIAWLGVSNYPAFFSVAGGAALMLGLAVIVLFRRMEGPVPQRKQIVLRKRYWLYYALTFMSGARRQIFVAFAAFLLVRTFGYGVGEVALLMLVTAAVNTMLAPRLGAYISRVGERPSIMFENVSLIVIFTGYALASSGKLGGAGAWVAAGLFILDGVFTTFYIAQKTYFQKIGDAEDMAPTAAVAFTINHIMAVIIPVVFGILAISQPDPSIIFWLGCGIALTSLSLAFLVPWKPEAGRETVMKARAATQPAE
jgi:hypothetical protein